MITNVALALGVLVLLPKLVEFAQHSWSVVWFPWQIDYDEGVNLNASWLLSNGTNIYAPNPPGHFVSALYPPLFYMLNAAAIKLMGLNLWSGRLLTLLGSLAAAGGLWAWVWAETRRHWAGALAATVWLSLGPVYVWSSFYKQDVPSIGLGVLGGAMLALWTMRYPSTEVSSHKKRNLLPYLAIIPLAASFWLKQSTIAAFGGAGLYLLMRDWRLGVRWAACAASSLLVPFVLLQLLTKGGMLDHLLAFNEFGRSTARLSQRAETLWINFWPLVAAGGCFLLGAIVLSLRARKVLPLSALYLLVSIPVTVLALLHPTGNYNHLLNVLAPLCLALGVATGQAAAWFETVDKKSLPALGGLVLGVVALGLAQAALVYGKPEWQWYTPLALPLDERAARMEQIDKAVRAAGGDVLSEDAWLLLKNGKRDIYDDTVAMSALAGAGIWNETTLLDDLRRRKYPLILLQYDVTGETYNPRWSPSALHLLQTNYSVRFGDVYFSYGPTPLAATPDTDAMCSLTGGPLLKGYTFNSEHANPGDSLPLALYWQTPAPQDVIDGNVKVFARVVNAEGVAVWQADWQPGQLAGKPWPGNNWQSGQIIQDNLAAPLPANLPLGRYRLQIGTYTIDPAGILKPLPMTCSQLHANPDGTLLLSEIEVMGR